jgi:predicted amidohydrolase
MAELVQESNSNGNVFIPDFTVALASIKFSGDLSWTYERNLEAALAATVTAIMRATAAGAHMIVLPEGFFWWWLANRDDALSHAVPFTRVVNYSPVTTLQCCNDASLHANSNSYVLDKICCLSASYNMFIVANIASSNCSSLSSSSSYCALYNTVIVFAPNASIAAT